jgi:hypothetical protein
MVQTHRDPAEIAGSMASLAYTMLATVSPSIEPATVGTWTMRLLCDFVAGNTAQRARVKGTIVDVRYTDFVADPIGSVRGVYEAHDLPWGEDVEAALRQGMADRPKNKHGRHEHDLSDVGLTENGVRETFSDYIDTFLS